MIRKVFYTTLFSITSLFASNLDGLASTTTEDLQPLSKTHSDVHPYIGLGFSTIAVLPYGANISIGARYAKENSIFGLDQSANYTSTFTSQYIFSKTLLPFYLNANEITNSYYAGPFMTVGYENRFGNFFDSDDDAPFTPTTVLLLINGFSFGKNIDNDGKLSFWQVSTNLRKFTIKGSETRTSMWPTLTFQYGVGF